MVLYQYLCCLTYVSLAHSYTQQLIYILILFFSSKFFTWGLGIEVSMFTAIHSLIGLHIGTHEVALGVRYGHYLHRNFVTYEANYPIASNTWLQYWLKISDWLHLGIAAEFHYSESGLLEPQGWAFGGDPLRGCEEASEIKYSCESIINRYRNPEDQYGFLIRIGARFELNNLFSVLF